MVAWQVCGLRGPHCSPLLPAGESIVWESPWAATTRRRAGLDTASGFDPCFSPSGGCEWRRFLPKDGVWAELGLAPGPWGAKESSKK